MTPDAPFRAQPPAPDGTVTFVPPEIKTAVLSNGIKVLFVERHDLPVVAVRILFNVGAGDVSGVRPGVMALTAAMLEQGTERRDALKLSDDFEAIGAGHSAWISGTRPAPRSRCWRPSSTRASSSSATSCSTRPSHRPRLNRLKSRRIAALKQQKNNPGSVASYAIARALYGRAHPYGTPLLGREEDVAKITRDDVVHAYEKLFVPGNATIVVAGDVSASIKDKLEAAFGAWKKGQATKRVTFTAPAGAGEPRVVFVDRPGAAQSQVYVVDRGAAFDAADRDALGVMNAILGGMFTSRINLNLREAHAYTYGAHSHFQLRHGAGPFTAGGAMKADVTIAAATEILTEIKRMRDEAVSADELAEAKTSLEAELPASFETVDEVAGAVGELAVYDRPLTEYATKAAHIEAVTAADVKRVATTFLRPNRFKLVIVGDKSKFASGLAGLKLGPAQEQNADGEVVH